MRLIVTVVLPMTVLKFVTPLKVRCRLTRSCVFGSPGASFTHTVML